MLFRLVGFQSWTVKKQKSLGMHIKHSNHKDTKPQEPQVESMFIGRERIAMYW